MDCQQMQASNLRNNNQTKHYDTMQNHIKKLRDYRNTHRIELMQLKTMRDLRDIDGNSEEVALLDSLISERIEYIGKIQSEIAIASGKVDA